MKKILLILLAFTSFASLAQAEFPEGIALSGNASSVNTSKIVLQEPTTGNLNYINALDLPASTADRLKGFLSTGLIKNGLISANGDPSKFNITAGVGIISNFDDPLDFINPISTIINFPAFNGVTPAYLNTGNITYIAINSTPAVVMQATPFTPEQRRTLIILGAAIHSNLSTINVLNNISAPTNADTNQLHDFMEAVGALNITGNKYTANGANLQLDKSAGVLFKLGSNFAVDWRNPHEIAQAGGNAITFRYRTQNGTESADMTSISPGLYDLNNVLTTVPNNKFTIQTVTVFQTGLTRIQWGQTIYDDLQSAKNALLTRDYVVENNIKENGVTRAYIIVRNSTASLQNVSDAYISEAQKFGGVASGGVALTLANIVTALGYTPENEANKSDSFTVSSSTTYSSTKALVDGLATKQNTLTNPITGTGTTNTIPKWTGTNTLGDGSIRDNVNVSIGTGGFSNKLTLYSAANEYALRVGQNTTNVTGSYTGITFFNSTNTGGTGSSTGTASLKITRMPANLQGNLAFLLGTTQVGMFDDYGHLLIATPTSNGIDGLQTPLTISHAAGTTANQGVIKSQLDLKANIDSQTFTGVPNVPTATTGTNTTQIASTAFVLANVNANAVLLTGDQTLSGVKTIDRTNVNLSSFRMFNNSSTSIAIENNNSDGIFRQSVNSSTGTHNRLYNESSGIANSNKNSSTGKFNINLNDINTGIFNDDSNTGSGIFNKNTNSGTGVFNDSFNISTGFFDKRRNDSAGILNYYDSNAGSTGDLQQYLKAGVVTAKINHLGELTAPKITMTGTIELKSYTVATLPTGVEGATAYVTDAIAPIYLGALTGGGTVKCPVFYNGTIWVSH